jgi:endonuclease/exonuclease/phosphatase family metal-dependent hydrolase
MRKVVITGFWVFNWIAAISLLLSIIAAYIDPQKAWVFAFFGIAYPVVLLINVFFVFLWLLLWKKYILLSLSIILIGWQNLTDVYSFHLSDVKSDSHTGIKIVTFNVHGFYGLENKNDQDNIRHKIIKYVGDLKPDIAFFQEFFVRGEHPDDVMAVHAGRLDLNYFIYTNYDGLPAKKRINAIAVFSKYRIINSGYLKLARKNTHAVFADVIINKDTIRLYNLHLASIRFGTEDYTFYSHLTDPENDNEGTAIKEGSKRMLWKLRKAFITRSIQVNELTTHVSASPYPTILGGDFNDTPYSYTYHKITKNLKDSFKETGSGFFESTYSGKLPSYRIDYITFSDHFYSVQYSKPEISLSDHFPVFTILKTTSVNKK